MTRKEVIFYTFVLTILGAGWGFTQPMSKLAVSQGYQHFGLIFWQLLIGTALMAVICAVRGISLPFRASHLKLYVIIAMIGTLIPNTFSYQAAAELPSGILSLLLSMIPMLAFPIALGLGLDHFQWRRFIGLAIGLTAVLLIVTPGQDFSLNLPVIWVLAMLIVCACYAFEGNYVARWGTEGLNALQVLYGASLVGTLLALPLAIFSGQWIDPRPPWGVPDIALIASSVAHVLVYAGYVWLVGKAGPIFTVQVSYLVTLFGIMWARLLLGETYSATVWISLVLMMVGMFLVQPRQSSPQEDRVAEP